MSEQMRFSASRLKLFNTCKLQFKYKYVDKLPEEREDTPDTFFGLLVHEVAEIYDGEKKDAIPIVRKYNDKLNEEYKQALPQTLNNLFKWYKKYKKYNSINEIELELKTEKYWLYGLVDKFFQDQKIFVDYKTARSANRERHIFQMKLYCLMISQLYEVQPKDVKCLIYYPRIDEEDKFMFSNSEIAMFEKHIIKLINEIEINEEWPPTKGYHCKWCGYKDKCPLFQE